MSVAVVKTVALFSFIVKREKLQANIKNPKKQLVF